MALRRPKAVDAVKLHAVGDLNEDRERLTACKRWIATAAIVESDRAKITCLPCRKALGLPMRRQRPKATAARRRRGR